MNLSIIKSVSFTFILGFIHFASGKILKSNSVSVNVAAKSNLVNQIGFDSETPEQINIYIKPLRKAATGTSATVRYKLTTDSVWKEAHPLIRINPNYLSTDPAGEVVEDSFAGVIFDLTPGAKYDVEVSISEPGFASYKLLAQKSTRALPGPAGPVTKTAAPSDNLQNIFNSLVPGDVLLLANGIYNVNNLYLNVQATAQKPIYIRGASRDGVILRDPADTILSTRNVSNIILEDLTFQGSGVDSGIDSSSTGILQANSGLTMIPTNLTVRRVTMKGVDRGIITYSPINGWLVYNCTFNGNNTWDLSYTVPNGEPYANLTWNDDGIRLAGDSNAAWENTLNGFGDAFATAVSPSYPVATHAVHYYRNKILMTGDDAWEADYGQRNISFYDNYIGNSGTFFSADPIFGGPAYIFRNISINTWRGPFKWNDDNYGMLVYSNTIIKTGNTLNGTPGWLWNQNNNGAQVGWSFKNNLIYKSGAQINKNILVFEAVGSDQFDFSYNGWYPDGNFNWRDETGTLMFSSLAEAKAGLPAIKTFLEKNQRHYQDIILSNDVFDPLISLSAFTTQYTLYEIPKLRLNTSARNSGAVIPGITDNFSGVAPDRGAVISGRKVLTYGDSSK